MIKINKTKIMLVLGILLPAVLITSHVSAGGNTLTGKISFLNIGNTVQIKLVDANSNPLIHNPDACALSDAYTLTRADNNGVVNEQFEDVLRGLVLARGTNANIKLNLNGCYTNSANKQRPSVNSVIIF